MNKITTGSSDYHSHDATVAYRRSLHNQLGTSHPALHGCVQGQERLFSSSSPVTVTTPRVRRRRNYPGFYDDDALENSRPPHLRRRDKGGAAASGGLEEPYQHGEASTAEYLKKTSLSPWTPLPDVVARKMFDLAKATPTDIHVDLGSGDGRVNFHAIDYGVGKSIGVDVDENIVEVAKQRLMKRHPAPDLTFYVADLMDERHPVWDKVKQATILTMYFAEPALEIFRPILERKLIGTSCRILTAGYAMPGWDSATTEVVLGTQIHLYHWGKSDADATEEDTLFVGEDILLTEATTAGLMPSRKNTMLQHHIEGDRFRGSKVIDRRKEQYLGAYDGDSEWDTDEEDEDENEEKEKSDRQDAMIEKETKKARGTKGCGAGRPKNQP